MKKTICIFLTAITVIASLISIIACNDTPNTVTDNVITDNPNGGMIIEESTVSNGITLLSEDIPNELYGDYGISAQAENARQITASVAPDDVTEKSVDWSVAWKNSDSEWAKGKSVTDYVTVTPTSDGSLTATIACLKAFGEQILVEVKSRVNPVVKAFCTVDYNKKLLDISVTIKNGTQTVLSLGGTPSATVNWTWLSPFNAESDVGR